jgi:hypothetical protein
MLWVEKEIHDRKPPATEDRPGFDRFGFLPFDTKCKFAGGSIEPVANYAEIVKWVRQHLYYPNLVARPEERFEPGILFPPTAWRQQHDPTSDDPIRVVVGSQAPPLLHRVPTSHYISLDGVADPQAEREGATAFLTKLFGFVQDAPTQFWDWWFDGAVSIKGSDLLLAPVVLEHFISHAYATWQSWAQNPQQLMISLLKMHGHAPGYRWHWERFSWEYTVTDTCYKVADTVWPGRFRTNGMPAGRKPNHGDRIKHMAKEFGLRFGLEEDEWVNFVVCLRNELLHEARWCDAQPSTKGTDASFRAPHFLHELNQRLIVALLGYQNSFVVSVLAHAVQRAFRPYEVRPLFARSPRSAPRRFTPAGGHDIRSPVS